MEVTELLLSKGADIHHQINGGYNALIAGIFKLLFEIENIQKDKLKF